MPQQPELVSKSTVRPTKGNSWIPFASWFEKRKENRLAAEEEAARLITNKLAENEQAIIRKLDAINFATSRMPKEVLDRKSNPKQTCGDLEWAARSFSAYLRKNPQVIKMDIRKIDEKLMTLVLLFKQAIDNGDERAAYAAKGGIYRAIRDIRSRVPNNQPELAKVFVEANTKYLDQWVTLTGMAQLADQCKRNAEGQRKRYNEDIEREKKKTENLRKELLENDEKLIAFRKLMKYETSQNRDAWTDIERDVYLEMLSQRLANVHTTLNNALLLQAEQDLAVTVGELDVLYAKVASLEIVADPNLMTKFKESVEDIVRKLAESDARIDESFKFMDQITGAIRQLDNAPGAIRAREEAAETAQNTLDKVLGQQEIDSQNLKIEAAKLRRDLGILDDEQLKMMREKAEAEQQLEMAKWNAMLREEAEERQAELQEALEEIREEIREVEEEKILIPN